MKMPGQLEFDFANPTIAEHAREQAEKVRRRKEQRKAVRAEFDKARRWGLARRHEDKLCRVYARERAALWDYDHREQQSR